MVVTSSRVQEINETLHRLGITDNLHRIELTTDEAKNRYGENYLKMIRHPYYVGADIYEGEIRRDMLEELLKIPEFSGVELWEGQGISEEGEESDEFISFIQLVFEGVELED